MSKNIVLSIIRHSLTFVGGILIMRGYMTEQDVLEIAGGVSTLVGAIWSVIDKNK